MVFVVADSGGCQVLRSNRNRWTNTISKNRPYWEKIVSAMAPVIPWLSSLMMMIVCNYLGRNLGIAAVVGSFRCLPVWRTVIFESCCWLVTQLPTGVSKVLGIFGCLRL
jgi:hypothetical protein